MQTDVVAEQQAETEAQTKNADLEVATKEEQPPPQKKRKRESSSTKGEQTQKGPVQGQKQCPVKPCTAGGAGVLKVHRGAVEEGLKVLGVPGWRPMQREAVEAVCCDGRDCIVCLPTGAGKSLCFQAPSCVLKRTVVVVSPLIALMEDQVLGVQSE